MDKVILYTTEDGYLAEVVPSENCGLTIEEVASKDVPEGIPYEIVDASDIPADRSFRDAWEWYPNLGVVTNVFKARSIVKDRLREQRKPMLEALDIQFMQLLESGQDTSGVVARKQLLRDAPDAVDSMTTIEELKAASLPNVGV